MTSAAKSGYHSTQLPISPVVDVSVVDVPVVDESLVDDSLVDVPVVAVPVVDVPIVGSVVTGSEVEVVEVVGLDVDVVPESVPLPEGSIVVEPLPDEPDEPVLLEAESVPLPVELEPPPPPQAKSPHRTREAGNIKTMVKRRMIDPSRSK